MKFITGIVARLRDMYAYRYKPEQLQALANLYWRTVLCMLMLVTISAVCYGAVLLLAVLSPSEAGNTLVSHGSAVPPLNRTQLQTALDGFAARQANYEFLKKNPSKSPDPSK